jgi:hypothetical protein
MTTDFLGKRIKKKTEWDTDEHGYTKIRVHEKTPKKLKTLQNIHTNKHRFYTIFAKDP